MARDLFCRRNCAGIVRHAIWAVCSFGRGFGGVALLTGGGGGGEGMCLRMALCVEHCQWLIIYLITRKGLMDSLARPLDNEEICQNPPRRKRGERRWLGLGFWRVMGKIDQNRNLVLNLSRDTEKPPVEPTTYIHSDTLLSCQLGLAQTSFMATKLSAGDLTIQGCAKNQRISFI